MFALERQKKTLEILERDGSVSVSKLSEEFEVTEETVRRDLEKLEKQELLRRTHGGAVSAAGGTNEASLKKRKNANVDAKIRMAKEAAKHIASGDTVFLDASTTTFFIAKELKGLKDITVITNSLRVADCLAGSSGIRLIAVGGTVSVNHSFVGTLAECAVEEKYFANKMFFSGKGVTAETGISESNEQECGIKRRMFKNSIEKYFLCDKSKIGSSGFMRLAGFDEIDFFITDAELDDTLAAQITESGAEVIVAR